MRGELERAGIMTEEVQRALGMKARGEGLGTRQEAGEDGDGPDNKGHQKRCGQHDHIKWWWRRATPLATSTGAAIISCRSGGPQ